MWHCYQRLLMSPFIILWCPVALLSLSASYILFISNNFYKIAGRVNMLGKYFFRWVVNDKDEWIFLPLQGLFRLDSNSSVNREPLLSSKDFYSSHDIFREKAYFLSNHNIQAATISASVCSWPGGHMHPTWIHLYSLSSCVACP